MSHIVTVWLPVKPQTTKDCLQHVPHSYCLATKQTTDYKVLATTRPTHTVTVWLPVKPQTTKDCLQHVPHSYCLATSEITDHKVLSTTCPVTIWLLNKPQTTQGCLQHVSNSYKKTSISEATVEIGTVIFDIVETAIF